MQTIQTLANEVLKAMQTKTRDNGDSFKSLVDGAPDWMSDLIQESHSGSLPDDHTYEFIFEALNALSDNEDTDYARQGIEPDTYSRDLLSWLSSSLSRASYVNDAFKEYAIDTTDFDLFAALSWGQLTEKQEVFELVLNQLQNRLDEVEAA